MSSLDTSSENRLLGALGPRVIGVVAVPALFLLLLGAAMTWWSSGITWERFLRAYLTSFMFILSLSLGGLFFTMLQHLARAGWSVVIRRVAEGLAANLRWIWILFIPIAVGMLTTDLYHWTHPGDDAVLLHKAPYLNKTFWLLRAAFFFATWGVLAHIFVSGSEAQDHSGDPAITLRLQKIAAAGMILYAVTQSYAVIDWVMALEPHWFSTMFGVYFFAASCAGFGSALILLVFGLQRSGRVTESITIEHYQDMGKFVFAFGIVFWAYIAYSQYMLIWYGNIPEETTWFLIRQLGSWAGLTVLLLFGHFILPFLALISRIPKRRPPLLAAIAAWVLLIHFVDMYWLVMPRYPAELVSSMAGYGELVEAFETPEVLAEYDMRWHIVDFTCLLGLAGLLLGSTVWALRRVPLIPQGDPRLGESLAFENY